MSQVVFEKYDNGLGKVILNRPEALNAINLEMIEQMLHMLRDWEKDDEIKVVLFDSASERAFSAGGDIKAFYFMNQEGSDMKEAEAFFREEYILDEMIYHYPKPVVANLNGIVMGGGVGLTYGADYKIITETTKWAMPEMNIALFPDVGGAYFLNQAPGYVGRYVALTSKTFSPSDVLYMNAANLYIKQQDLRAVVHLLESTNWHDEAERKQLNEKLANFKAVLNETSFLESHREQIDKHFQYNSVEEIFTSLKQDDSAFAKEALQILESVSPVSLKVTLEQLIRGKNLSVGDCLKMDLVLAKNFLKHDDFYEGVRSVLVDKDRKPNYKYKTLVNVSKAFVRSFFE